MFCNFSLHGCIYHPIWENQPLVDISTAFNIVKICLCYTCLQSLMYLKKDNTISKKWWGEPLVIQCSSVSHKVPYDNVTGNEKCSLRTMCLCLFYKSI